MHYKSREHAAISLIDQFYPARTTKPILIIETASRAGTVEKENIRAIHPQEISRGGMPEIFANQHANTPVFRIESANAVACREIARFIKHAISRQIKFVMQVEDFFIG